MFSFYFPNKQTTKSCKNYILLINYLPSFIIFILYTPVLFFLFTLFSLIIFRFFCCVGKVWAVDWSPDGEKVASGGLGKALKLWKG